MRRYDSILSEGGLRDLEGTSSRNLDYISCVCTLTSLSQIFGSGSSPPPLQSGSYMFYALEPSSQYEVVIAGYNDWGWALNSEPFFFSTRATGSTSYVHVKSFSFSNLKH